MAEYKVEISKTAQKQLDKLPDAVADVLLETIKKLSNNPRPAGYIKLRGRQGYRIRKGDYRIIYDVFDEILLVDVIAVGHRKDI